MKLKIDRPYFVNSPLIGGYWLTLRKVIVPISKKNIKSKGIVVWSASQVLQTRSKHSGIRFNRIDGKVSVVIFLN